jgi:hypothetical protein
MDTTELVRGMSPEDKGEIFVALLREALQYNGDAGLMHVEDEEGRPFGYYVPPKAAAEQFRSLAPILSPEQRAASLQALSTLEKTFDMKVFLNDLALEDAAQD